MRTFLASLAALALCVSQVQAQGYIPPAGGGSSANAVLNNQANTYTAGPQSFAPSTTATAGINCGQGAQPTTPINGDFWCTSNGAFHFFGGAQHQYAVRDSPSLSAVTLSDVTGSTQCLHVSSVGLITGTGSDCGSGGGGNPFPAYKSGYWYSSLGTFLSTGVANGNGGVFCVPWVALNSMTVKAFNLKVTTATATGTNSVAVGLFAPTGATGYPASSPTVSASTTLGTSTGFITATPGSPVTISAGMYWACVQTNDATVVFQAATALMSPFSGFAAGGSLVANTNATTGYISLAGTYGTWPANSSWSSSAEAATTNHGVFVGIQEN
ncbi:MAG TPA: hypothetical protein VG248_03490 [Caulobacteraceae bacterium]|jgi:hypothetical protein|nr:hypothetical protein [Caulobacteraceae bacterium]